MKRSLLVSLLVSLASAFGTTLNVGISEARRRYQEGISSSLSFSGGAAQDEARGINGAPGPTISEVNVTTPFNKTEEEYSFIEESLSNNVLFTSLPKVSLHSLIDSFERVPDVSGVIVQQGDPSEGGYVYLIAEGECTVAVDGKEVPEPYGTLKPRSIFGERGVLYKSPRAATISCKTDKVTLYRLDGDKLKRNLNENDYLILSNETDDLIDNAIQQVSGTRSLYGGDIIRQYKPNRVWLWRRWTGTVLQHSYRTTLLNMLYSLAFIALTRRLTDPSWHIGLAPDHSHPFIQRLDIIRKLWSYQMSLTTFILTFFVNQAYSFWQDVHITTRRIQGRLNDFHLLLATSAARRSDGAYTTAAERLLDDVGSSSRLLHALFWASCARRFEILRTPRGLERMAVRGLMTSKQLQALQSLDLPNNQKHNACLEWMMIRARRGVEDGTLLGGEALLQRLLDISCQLRGTYASINDRLSCRMPLPYAHFVQVLVDSFVWIAPLALYAELGAYSVICVGIMTLFYTGLLDLAKIFLDPLDNEEFTKNSIDLDIGVLIRESNAGSTRWKNAGASLPF